MAPHPARTEAPPLPKGDRSSKAVPMYVTAILDIVRVLLGYGKHLDVTLPEQAEHPRFPTLAAGFGTHDLRRILNHVQRGILRAMMLQRFLLARAVQGRDIEPIAPPAPAEPQDIEALEIKLRTPRETQRRAPRIDPDDPLHFRMPTLKELEAQVRRRSVGRTIAEICLDLGVAPIVSEGGFWNEIYKTLLHFGGSSENFFAVQISRRKAFEKERQKRPDTWSFDWQDRPKDAMRQMLGYLLGEPPPHTVVLAASA